MYIADGQWFAFTELLGARMKDMAQAKHATLKSASQSVSPVRSIILSIRDLHAQYTITRCVHPPAICQLDSPSHNK
ncbi:hypothetical protein B5X24_HaOG212789 [Helicoverpa armigera]|nr:hypothetical protein B5X24_HaOG212789 [Helicoverpa armigera]